MFVVTVFIHDGKISNITLFLKLTKYEIEKYHQYNVHVHDVLYRYSYVITTVITHGY